MNTKIEMLKAAAENLNEKRVAARKVVRDGLLAVMKRVVAESGVPTAYIDEEHFNIESPKVYVERKGERGCSGPCIDVYFRRDWFNKDKERKLEINVSSCGSFGKDNDELVAYYSLVGYMSINLAKIEADLNALDWESYDTACRICNTAFGELKTAEQEEKKAAYEKAAAEFEAKLVAGAKVVVGKKFVSYERDENGEFKRDANGCRISKMEDVIYTIEKVTAKMIYWADYNGQGKKADVIRDLVSGNFKLVA